MTNKNFTPIDNTYSHSQPQALDVEVAVLGALIIDDNAFTAIKHIINADSFYDKRNKKIFEAIKKLADAQKPVDLLTVNDQLSKDGVLEDIGGSAYVAEISSKVATSAHVVYHAQIIAEKQLQRLAFRIAQETETKALDDSFDIQEELRNFQKSIDQLTSAANGRYEEDFEPLPLSQVIEEEKLEPDGLETQYSVHDKGGNYYNLEIPAKQLTLIGAQTSHGKSRLLENLAVNLIGNAKDNEVLLYYTFEESRNMVFEEMLSIYTDSVPLSRGRNIDTIRKYFKGNHTYINNNADIDKFNVLAKDFDEKQRKHLRIINKPYSVEEVIDNIKFLNGKFKKIGMNIKAVFIDYIQLMHREKETGNTKADICYIMRKLQDFAVLDAKLPIILAAQLNRQAGSPLDLHNQNMADASDIEHNACMVIMEWNSSFKPLNGSTWDKPEGKTDKERLMQAGFTPGIPGKMYLLITKWRGGPRGSEAILEFNQNTGLIWDKDNISQQNKNNKKDNTDEQDCLF